MGLALCLLCVWFGARGGWVVAQARTHADDSVGAISIPSLVGRTLLTLEGETRPQDLPLYVQRLQTSVVDEQRRLAADDLGNLFERGTPAVPVLLEALRSDPSPSVRREAVDALLRIRLFARLDLRAHLERCLETESSPRVRRGILELMSQ